MLSGDPRSKHAFLRIGEAGARPSAPAYRSNLRSQRTRPPALLRPRIRSRRQSGPAIGGGKSLAPTTAGSLVAALAEGVQHAHGRGVVSRQTAAATMALVPSDAPEGRSVTIPRVSPGQKVMCRCLSKLVPTLLITHVGDYSRETLRYFSRPTHSQNLFGKSHYKLTAPSESSTPCLHAAAVHLDQPLHQVQSDSEPSLG